VAASVGAKVFSMACTLAQVPLALHYLGTEAYGFWITLSSIALVLNTVDFGVGVGMQHAMATAYGREDLGAVRRLFWTGVAALSVLGAAVLILGGAAVWAGSWADILKIHDPALRADTRRMLAIALGAFALALPFNAVNRLAAALQRGWINAGWVAAGSALSLTLVAAAAVGHWGLAWFLAASLLLPVIQGLGLLLHLCRVLGWTLAPNGLAPAAETRALLGSSFTYALPQAGMALVQSVPALAISMAAGASAVTAYNLLMRLFGPLQQGQVLLLTPVWPAYTEARVRGDAAWIERTFWRTAAAFGAIGGVLAIVAWQSRAILQWWIGGQADQLGFRLTAVVGLWAVLQMAAQPSLYYLMGVGRLRQLAWAATPGFFASVAALFWGSRGGTVAAVLLAGSAALALLLLPPLLGTTFSALRADRRGAGSP